ncbi:hypothetical protein GCM10008955_01380 [Deinococcus malanensis]|uniref:Uncharacterized protein n=1 Tax=Deinococcus malanensis TaxID=1706855 RepID=A0ABQ2EGQ3_9DEIO|nr:hypothetical protein GCM10008955_01380 [Deinococcus malanensis]
MLVLEDRDLAGRGVTAVDDQLRGLVHVRERRLGTRQQGPQLQGVISQDGVDPVGDTLAFPGPQIPIDTCVIWEQLTLRLCHRFGDLKG